MNYNLPTFSLCISFSLAGLIALTASQSQADERIHARGTYGNYSAFGVTKDVPVVVYTAPWCDACTDLQLFLQQQAITFKTVNIGKDKAAAKLLKAKNLSSLPVIIIKNTLLQGYSKTTVSKQLAQLKAAP